MNKKELEGVVFDADGTLFDTERLGYWAWEEAGRQMGCPQAADCYPEVVGRGRGDVLALLPRLLGPDFPHEPFMELRSRLATERMEREGVPVKEGAREVLEFLQSGRCPWRWQPPPITTGPCTGWSTPVWADTSRPL